MGADDARRFVLLAWLALIGMQVAGQATTAALAGKQDYMAYLPTPSKLIAGAVIFTILGGMAELAPQLAIALAAGTDLAIFLAPTLGGVSPATTLGNLAQAISKLR